jgi:dethiobiotin synthetase
MTNPVPGLFITGTDTGVGKTHVAAMIARQLAAEGRRVGVYKPAASGCQLQGDSLISDDAVALWEAAGRPGELERVCPQRFAAPLAPHLAAVAEGRKLDQGLLRGGLDYWQERSDIILVEGAGGLLSPMGDVTLVADLAAEFGFPLIVVSRNALGAINQTLQTLVAAAAYGTQRFGEVFRRDMDCQKSTPVDVRGLSVAGVVLNNPGPTSVEDASQPLNRNELVVHSRVAFLAEVAWGQREFVERIDWFALAK